MSKLRKGVIVEVNNRDYVVLNDSGAFVRMPKRGRAFAVGEEIALPDVRRALPRRSIMKWASAACAAMVLFGFLFTMFPREVAHAELVAYVSIDINPSVELGLDRDGKVVQVREKNEAATELVEGLSLLGLPVEEAVSLIMESAETKLFAKRSEADIVITSVILDDMASVSEEELQQRVENQVSQVIQQYHPEQTEQYRVTVWSAPKEVLQEAEEAGLSAGKMTFYLKAKASGVELSTEQLKRESIHEVAKQYEEKKLLAPDPLFTKETIIELLEHVKVAKDEAKAALKAAKEEEKTQERASKQQEQQAKKQEQEEKKLEKAAEKAAEQAEKKLEQLRKQEEKEAEKQERSEERVKEHEEKIQELLEKKRELEEEKRKRAEERAKEQEDKRQEQSNKKQEQEEKKQKEAEERSKEQEDNRQKQVERQRENEEKKQEREEELSRKAEERLLEREEKKREQEEKKQEREKEKEKKKEQGENNGNPKGKEG